MTSNTLPTRVNLRVYHGGEFKCKEGKFEYVGGSVHHQYGVLYDDVTVQMYKKLALRLTSRDDSEIWYRRSMRSISDANGKGLLVSCFDLVNLLKTLCKNTKTLTVWITPPTTIESFASTILQKTKSANVGPLEKDVVVGNTSLCGKQDSMEAHNSLICPIQFKAPTQQSSTPTNAPHSPLLPLRRSPKQHKNTTEISSKQITKNDLVNVNVNTGREKLPLRRNLNIGVQPGIVFRDTDGDCDHDQHTGGVSGVVSGFIELGVHKKADRKGKAKVNDGIILEFGHFKKTRKGKSITTVRKKEKKVVVRKRQKKKRSKLGKCVCGTKNSCKFRVHARNVTDEIFQITGLNLKHNCIMSTYNKKVSSEYLAEKYIEFWRNNSDWKLQKFQKHVLQELGVHVTYMKCWLARSRAKLMIHGNSKDKYAKVWEYASTVLKYNPSSSAFVVCDNIERPPPIFKRFYICLKACKEGFITGCRPILGVDGCHLRGVYPDMCLVTVGIGVNNNIFSVAWAVVEVENRESWTCFLELLANDIGKVEGEGLTVMSDRQKGLIDPLSTVVPKANIRFCARHIWANLKLRFSGQLFKETFWAAARALTRANFSKEMEGIKLLSRDAWSFLNDILPRHWSRHAFDTSCKSHLLLNNVCEVFNVVLKDARDKPILTQLEWMRKYVMQKICQKREGAKSYEGRVMPYATKYLDWARDESRFATFMQSDDHEFEVELRGEQVVVNLKDKSCGCNHWNITGLPCPHAMTCLLEKRIDPIDYVDESYSKDRYMLTYANKVSPMPEVRHWKATGMAEPLPPALRTMLGRPKSKKKRKEAGEKEEQQLKKGKRPKNYSKYEGSGHYKRTCKNPPALPKIAIRAPSDRTQKRIEWAKNIREKAMTRAAQKEA